MAINPMSRISVTIPEVTQQDLIDRVLRIEMAATPVDAPEWLAEKIQKAALDALEPFKGCVIDAGLIVTMNEAFHSAILRLVDDFKRKINNQGV